MELTSLQLNAIDIGVLILVIWEIVLGIKRGLTKELPRFIGTTAVFFVSLWGYRIVGNWLVMHTKLADYEELAYAISYIVIAVLVAAFIIILRTLIGLLLTIKFNDSIEKPLGGVFGFLRALLLSMHLIFMAGLLPNTEIRGFVFGSVSGKATFKVVPFMMEKVGWLKDKGDIPQRNSTSTKEKRYKKSSDTKEFLKEED